MGILLTAQGVEGSGTILIIYVVLIAAFLYFMMIRPQKK